MPRGTPAVVNGQKWCNDCQEHLPFEMFYKCARNKPHGLSDYCKPHENKRVRPYSDHYRRKVRTGVTSSIYLQMLKAQKGVCAICKLPETQTYRGNPKQLAVDHCHEEGTVRGLLCASCNNGLGRFKDDPSLLREAANYLENSILCQTGKT